MEKNYRFVDKALFFPENGILVIGDLHIGYDLMLQQSGILIPERQVDEVIDNLKRIFKEIKKEKFLIKKIIFLGDIKHFFGFEWKEKNYFNEVLEFLKKHFSEKNIILIKGNHDTIDYFGMMRDYYISGDIAFIHGHKSFSPIFNKKIKMIILGHLHPSVTLSDKYGIKREKYKCFLVGKFKGKKIIIMPSFLTTIEGTTVNSLDEEYEDYFSIIPKRALKNFEVYVVNKDNIYNFGKIKDLG